MFSSTSLTCIVSEVRIRHCKNIAYNELLPADGINGLKRLKRIGKLAATTKQPSFWSRQHHSRSSNNWYHTSIRVLVAISVGGSTDRPEVVKSPAVLLSHCCIENAGLSTDTEHTVFLNDYHLDCAVVRIEYTEVGRTLQNSKTLEGGTSLDSTRWPDRRYFHRPVSRQLLRTLRTTTSGITTA